MTAIFGEGKIFWKLQRLHSLDTLWVENFDEIAKQICVLPFLAKIQNGRHFFFWGGGEFFENCKDYIP